MPPTKVEEITTSSVTIFQTLKEVLTYDLSRRKEPRSDKMKNILSTNLEKLVNEVLEALPPETTSVAMAHNKYWTNTWRDHTSSYIAEYFATINSAYIAWALSTSI